MAEKISQDIKELREKVYELEDEMSVSTKNNNFVSDISKSKRLLIYRYILLLQIKDLRKERRKIETRIDKLNTLKSQSARGRMLTKREMEAIENIKVDIRKREDVTEEYDNKKEIYSDKRLVYYGIDDELIKVFYKHAQELEDIFEVTEKNVLDLKKQLDDSNNISEDMDTEQIVSANEDRYGDEIVDFELGIILDSNDDVKENKVEVKVRKEANFSAEAIEAEEKAKEDAMKNKEQTFSDEEDEEETIVVKDPNKKFNYYNGYNLYKEDMEEIILDSIEKDAEEYFSNENNLKDENRNENDDKHQKISAKTFEDELNEKYKKGYSKKTDRQVKDKMAVKEKLENYINDFGNDMTREYYNNEMRNTTLDNDKSIDEIDQLLNCDLYELGILYIIDQKIKKKKSSGDSEEAKVLINRLYQIKMQYKLFPGYCFEDIKEFEPEEVVKSIKEYCGSEVVLEPYEIYKAANTFTISCDEIRERYRRICMESMHNEGVISSEMDVLDNDVVTNE